LPRVPIALVQRRQFEVERFAVRIQDQVDQEFLHPRIVARAFDAAIPGAVVVGTIAVLLAVRRIVFVVVGDEIVECEAIVTGHEVHALLRLALLVTVDFRAANHPVGKSIHRTADAAQEVAGVVAESPVPLLPTVADKAAHLVQTSGIPRLSDQLRACQQRVRFNVPKHGRAG
jgi:hypothetical protein